MERAKWCCADYYFAAGGCLVKQEVQVVQVLGLCSVVPCCLHVSGGGENGNHSV